MSGRAQTRGSMDSHSSGMRESGHWRTGVDQDQGNRIRGGRGRVMSRRVRPSRVRGQFGIKHKIWIKRLPMKDQEYLNAALSGDIATLTRVIREKQVDLNVTDGFGHTALINAAWKDRADVVELLLKKRVSLNCRNHDGQTAMDKAAYWGFTKILQLLVDAGSKIDVVNNNGETPLHRAAMWGHDAAVKLLLEANANPDMYKNQRRWTPLHFAAKHGKSAVVLALLEGKCDPHMRDSNGRTPMELARRNKQPDVVLLLDKWLEYQEDLEREQTDPVIAHIDEAGGWDAPPVASSNGELKIANRVCECDAPPVSSTNGVLKIAGNVCGFKLSALNDAQGSPELKLSLVSRDDPSISLCLAVTSDEVLEDENFLSFDTQLSSLNITPPTPKFTLERQEALNAGLRGKSHRASQVLAFQRLPGLQVAPANQKTGSKKLGKQDKVATHSKDATKCKEKSKKDGFLFHSPYPGA